MVVLAANDNVGFKKKCFKTRSKLYKEGGMGATEVRQGVGSWVSAFFRKFVRSVYLHACSLRFLSNRSFVPVLLHSDCHRTWFGKRIFYDRAACAAVCEDKQFGGPGVAAACVQHVGSFGAYVQRKLQRAACSSSLVSRWIAGLSP